ncbi:MAG: helix-turn-helix domain-containing protein [Campylobacter sp.]|nr:helix-turn-helix domain-containing protein [Campylobacter sp.]
MILGAKKLEIIEFLLEKQDENGFIFFSLSELCEQTKCSKPTAINTLNLLRQKNVLEKLKNGLYKFK